MVGGFEDIVLAASRTRGRVAADPGIKQQQSSLKYSYGNIFVPEKEWGFFNSEFARNRRGFSVCHCNPPNAVMKCNYDSRCKDLQKVLQLVTQLESSIADGAKATAIDRNNIIQQSTKVLADIFGLSKQSLAGKSIRPFLQEHRCRLRFIRAKAYESCHSTSFNTIHSAL